MRLRQRRDRQPARPRKSAALKAWGATMGCMLIDHRRATWAVGSPALVLAKLSVAIKVAAH